MTTTEKALREALEICHGGMIYATSVDQTAANKALNEYIVVACNALNLPATPDKPLQASGEDWATVREAAESANRLWTSVDGKLDSHRNDPVAALSRLQTANAQGVPVGWQLVEKDMTNEHWARLVKAYPAHANVSPTDVADLWQKFLVTAPQPPINTQGE